VPGFARAYRAGRRAERAARKKPDDERLHELRKRTKDLWHAAQIVRPLAPKPMGKVVKRAHELADLLGDDHDLAVLLATARDRRAELADGELDRLQKEVGRRRKRLQRRALKRARRVYRRRPRRLAAQLSAGAT